LAATHGGAAEDSPQRHKVHKEEKRKIKENLFMIDLCVLCVFVANHLLMGLGIGPWAWGQSVGLYAIARCGVSRRLPPA
jgi:hypothetical protein